VFAPGSATCGARRTPRRLPGRISPPSQRTPRTWRGRRCAGTDVRARVEPRSGRARAAGRSRWSAAARLPTDHDRARRRGVPQPVGVYTEGASCLAVGHLRPAEESVQADGLVFREPPAFRIERQPPEREEREVACCDHIRVVPMPPELDERGVLPGGRFGPLDAGMDREERGSGHAVLQARLRRTAEQARSAGEPLVERADVSAERQDLHPRQVEPRPVIPRRSLPFLSRCIIAEHGDITLSIELARPQLSRTFRMGRVGRGRATCLARPSDFGHAAVAWLRGRA
jgi:hypothetical protein